MAYQPKVPWQSNMFARPFHHSMSRLSSTMTGRARRIYCQGMKEYYQGAMMAFYECGIHLHKCLPLRQELCKAATSHPSYLQNSYLIRSLLLRALIGRFGCGRTRKKTTAFLERSSRSSSYMGTRGASSQYQFTHHQIEYCLHRRTTV